MLWRRIRNRQLDGFKFVRQAAIGRYFPDFVCRERRLIIEVDGSQHADSNRDRERDAKLMALGYRIVRVWNNDVLRNLEGVFAMLQHELKIAPHPSPLPVHGEREPVTLGDGSSITRSAAAC